MVSGSDNLFLDYDHPDPASPVNVHSAHAMKVVNQPLTIHSPDCTNNPLVMNSVIYHAVKALRINPLSADSSDYVVIIAEQKHNIHDALSSEKVQCYFPDDSDDTTEQSFERFVENGGILVTNRHGMTGVEAKYVIVIGSDWRDAVLRTVSGLVFIDNTVDGRYWSSKFIHFCLKNCYNFC